MVFAIFDDNSYSNAKAFLDSLMDLKELNAEKSAQLRAQALIISDWEKTKYPKIPMTAIEAIKFRSSQGDWSRKKLAELFGGRSKMSEVFRGNRKLSMAMIKRIHLEMDIPLAVLIQDVSDIID